MWSVSGFQWGGSIPLDETGYTRLDNVDHMDGTLYPVNFYRMEIINQLSTVFLPVRY